MTFHTINPATAAPLETYTAFSEAALEASLRKAAGAFQTWSALSYAERAVFMRSLAELFRARKHELARRAALEMGKPLTQGVAEAEKCAVCCEFYADHAEEFLADRITPTEATRSYVTHKPLGGVLAIMPWNFPFWQVIRCFVPAAMAGNVMLLKHAPNTFGCAIELERLVRDAGFPEGVLQTLIVDVAHVEWLIHHPFVQAVTLTGSSRAGAAVAALAGANLKKSVLELGGSDPYIILDDADVEAAVQICVAARLHNSGQSCIAAKRFIVVEPLGQRVEEAFVEMMRPKTFGNPLNAEAGSSVGYGYDIGPMARQDLRDGLHAQVQHSVTAGATLLLGGTIPEGQGYEGWFYPPTVLANVQRGMAAYHEELFGPVASIIRVRGEEDAIAVANDSAYGLGGAVFTQDVERGERIARERINAGFCVVNDFVRSDARLPFGGVKASGYGRELADAGIREFVNVKTIVVR
jgi:succinate-semialdehyde dehydrogenase/glutarate-semialdehyde dehydrogenase